MIFEAASDSWRRSNVFSPLLSVVVGVLVVMVRRHNTLYCRTLPWCLAIWAARHTATSELSSCCVVIVNRVPRICIYSLDFFFFARCDEASGTIHRRTIIIIERHCKSPVNFGPRGADQVLSYTIYLFDFINDTLHCCNCNSFLFMFICSCDLRANIIHCPISYCIVADWLQRATNAVAADWIDWTFNDHPFRLHKSLSPPSAVITFYDIYISELCIFCFECECNVEHHMLGLKINDSGLPLIHAYTV